LTPFEKKRTEQNRTEQQNRKDKKGKKKSKNQKVGFLPLHSVCMLA